MTKPATTSGKSVGGQPTANCPTPRADGEGSVPTSRREYAGARIMGADPAGQMAIRAALATAVVRWRRSAGKKSVYQAAELERLGRRLPGLLEGACDEDKAVFV